MLSSFFHTGLGLGLGRVVTLVLKAISTQKPLETQKPFRYPEATGESVSHVCLAHVFKRWPLGLGPFRSAYDQRVARVGEVHADLMHPARVQPEQHLQIGANEPFLPGIIGANEDYPDNSSFAPDYPATVVVSRLNHHYNDCRCRCRCR